MSRSRDGTWLTTRSPIFRTPREMSSSPATIRSAVVLPQPDGPTRTMNSPSSIARSRPLTAVVPSAYVFVMPSNETPATHPPSVGVRVFYKVVTAPRNRNRLGTCEDHSSRVAPANRRYAANASRNASRNESSRRGANPSSHQRLSTSTLPASRSIRGSIRPTKRSRKTIGSTYQPQRRLSGGWKSSHTYSNPKSACRNLRSQTSGSKGGRNATEGGGSGGDSSSATSSGIT